MADQATPHTPRVDAIFHRDASKRLAELRQGRPQKTADHAGTGLNARIALRITAGVGTMICAYVFSVIALVGAYAIIGNNTTLNLVIILISQTFLQLVLLPVIIVGQNIQGKAADARADSTYKDAEAILHECMQLQEHLQAQDKILDDVLTHLHDVMPPATA